MRGYSDRTLKTLRVSGVDYQISVLSSGKFHANVNGETVSEDTLDACERKIKRLAKREKIAVEIPFTQTGQQLRKDFMNREAWIAGSGVRHGVATSIHGRTNNVLVRFDDGDIEQLDRYGHRTDGILRRLTADESTEWSRLHREATGAADRLSEFEKRHAFTESLYETVKAAQAKALEARDAGEVTEEPDEDPRPLVAPGKGRKR